MPIAIYISLTDEIYSVYARISNHAGFIRHIILFLKDLLANAKAWSSNGEISFYSQCHERICVGVSIHIDDGQVTNVDDWFPTYRQ